MLFEVPMAMLVSMAFIGIACSSIVPLACKADRRRPCHVWAGSQIRSCSSACIAVQQRTKGCAENHTGPFGMVDIMFLALGVL